MLKISALGCKNGRAAITFWAEDRKDTAILVSLFAPFIESWFSREVYLDDMINQFPLDVEVTAIYEESGKFGWTWKRPSPCNTDCARYRQGDCPFVGRKDQCPRVREQLNNP